MSRGRLLFAVIASSTLASPLMAEKVNMSPEALRETATHVVTGQATKVYERVETTKDWKYTRYLVEVRVRECEKGAGIKKDDLVYARYWRRSWIGNGDVPTGTSGHRGLPSDGESLRVYLARNAYDGFGRDNTDNGFNVIGANGFEKLKPDSTD